MRVLITGAHGQLGKALQRVLSGQDLILKDLPEFDLKNPACGEQIRRANPEIILHVGAYTNVDQAEHDHEQAHAINAEGTRLVADAARTLNARLIYVSTDYVFDGTKTTPYHEQDQAHPLNQYGHSKYLGEQAVLSLCPDGLVVRTAWLFGHEGKNFVKTIMQLSEERPVLEIVADQRGCPTYAEDLARALGELAVSNLRGICHVTNSGDSSWFEFAQAIVRQAGRQADVRPITTAEAKRPAKRPSYSVLSHARYASHYPALPDWQDALSRFIKRVSQPLPHA